MHWSIAGNKGRDESMDKPSFCSEEGNTLFITHIIFAVLLIILTAAQAIAGPLHEAADRGDAVGVKASLQKGADINAKDTMGNTALVLAARHGHRAVVKLLIEKGANMNILDARDMTALSWAVGRDDIEMVKLLIKYGADVNDRSTARTALEDAAMHGYLDMVKLLIAKGANVNLFGERGRTALMSAVGLKDIEIAKLLIERGADVNARRGSETALLNAAGRDHPEIIALLIEHGAEECEVIEVEGSSDKSREEAVEEAMDRALEMAFGSQYDLISGHDEKSTSELAGKAFEKLKSNRKKLIRSHEVVSEERESNGVYRARVKAAVYKYKIKEQFGDCMQNLD